MAGEQCAVDQKSSKKGKREKEQRGHTFVSSEKLAEAGKKTRRQGDNRGHVPDALDQADIFRIPGIGADVEDKGKALLEKALHLLNKQSHVLILIKFSRPCPKQEACGSNCPLSFRTADHVNLETR